MRKSLPTDDYNQLYNFGICGETTTDLLKRFAVEAEAINPDQIIFAIGINDSKFPTVGNKNRVTPNEFTENLRALVEQARRYTDHITLVGLTKVTDEWRSVPGSRFLNEAIETYDAIICKLAEEKQCRFISVMDIINPATDLADGLHPNAVGYQKLFEKISSEWS